jgi:hypothetical protein
MNVTALLFTFLIVLTGSWCTKPHYIIWSSDIKLGFADFRCIPPPKSPHSATSTVGVCYECEPIYNGWNVQINAYFDKSKSWFKRQAWSEGLLNHEQGHFDIYHLHSLMMRKTVMNTHFSPNSFDVKLKGIFDSLMVQCEDMGRNYDMQTNHGVDSTAQRYWEKRIELSLDSMMLYNTPSAIRVKWE